MPPLPAQAEVSSEDGDSDVSFGGFGDDDEAATSSRGAEVTLQFEDKDSDEEELERLVLGNGASFREQLLKGLSAGAGDQHGKGELQLVANAQPAPDSGLETVDDSALFFIATDREPTTATTQPAQDPTADGRAPAWEDSDDERLSVSLASATRLRKLRLTEGEDVVSGSEYTRRLRQQYLRLHPQPSWVPRDGPEPKRRRRSSAGSADVSSGDSASDDDDGDVDDALPLESFLRDSRALVEGASGTQRRKKLRPETINIQKTRDIPDTHKGPVESLSFHPLHPILLSSSTSSILHLNHIAPEAYPKPHPLLTSVQIKNVPIRRAEFLRPNGDQVVFAGRRRFFQSWNLSTGLVTKVSKIQGHRLEQKTVERFRLSPCGRYMAMIATDRKGGGMLNIVRVGTMQWISQARLDGRGGIADFCWWRTGEGITILGRDGQVGEWELESKRIVGVWRDSGSTGGTVLALGGQQGPSELGGDRWVAIGSNSGILQVYDRQNLIAPPQKSTGDADVGEMDGGFSTTTTIKTRPDPTRVFESLTTPITVVAFSPDCQLLAFGSKHKKDAFKLAHMPSCTLYRNWPTAETPFGRISAVAFGTQSDLLAVGNDAGKIRLWEIRG